MKKKSQTKKATVAVLPRRGARVTNRTVRKIQEDIDRVEEIGSRKLREPAVKPECSREMTTFTGLYVDPRNLQPDQIRILDIAHGLSNICRFAGQCVKFYSVAQHSFLCAWALWHEIKGQPGDKELALTALLHDAPEAYIGDLVRCVKVGLPDYEKMEEKIWGAVCDKFQLHNSHPELPPKVKEADYRMLVTERRALISDRSAVWDLEEQYKPYEIPLIPTPPEKSKEMFLDAYVAFSGLPVE